MSRRPRQRPRLSVVAWILCAVVGVALVGLWDRDASPAHSLSDRWSPSPAGPVAGQALPASSGAGSTGARDLTLAPVAIDIPAIDVSSPLVWLGLRPNGTVEVPADPDSAGWFRRGTEPGRRGSAVILGHVDSEAGPAVFARLRELDRGDSVTVERADGSVVEFAVMKSVTYLNADFPAQRVYAAQGAQRLNLVTCTGAYDADRGGYQANLVVYTQRSR